MLPLTITYSLAYAPCKHTIILCNTFSFHTRVVGFNIYINLHPLSHFSDYFFFSLSVFIKYPFFVRKMNNFSAIQPWIYLTDYLILRFSCLERIDSTVDSLSRKIDNRPIRSFVHGQAVIVAWICRRAEIFLNKNIKPPCVLIQLS